MAPLPISSSRSEDWDDTRAEDKILSGDGFAALPGTLTSAPEALEAKRKKSPSKALKSPRPVPVSPLSTDGNDEKLRQKEIIDSTRKERKQSTPPPPPLSQTCPNHSVSATPTRNKSNNNKSISNKSNNKSISNKSPRTDLKHRQVANAAAEAASLRRHRRPRKKLYWNNSVRVKVVHNLTNYTPQEKLDAWYWADEYSMMEDECELTSIYMDEIAFERENAIQEDTKSKCYKRTLPAGFCERGLESWTMQGEELKEQRVQLVIDTVWQAQIDAWEFLGNHPSKSTDMKDTDDKSENAIHNECWKFIRERASAVSRPSQVRAREFAIKDEQEVDSYLNSVRSLEQSRRRITKMLGQNKHSSSRNLTRSTRTLTTAKSCRTLTTVSSSGSRSLYGGENLKSILKSTRPSRAYSDTRSIRKSPSHSSRVPLKSSSEHSKDNSTGSFRIRLPKIGDDSASLRSASLRSASLRSKSLRSNSLRSKSLRSNSLRSNLSRSQSVRTNSVGGNSLRSNLSRSNSLRSSSLRSNGNSVHSNVSSSSFLSNSSKKIRYKPKSKTKIPTSPVGSVCNSMLSSQNQSNSNHGSLTDEEDLSMRMMRSHMSLSLGSEGSSRRRMLRASTAKPPL